MAYTTMLGIINFASDLTDIIPKELSNHIHWFDGFAHGMHEAGALTKHELETTVSAIKALKLIDK